MDNIETREASVILRVVAESQNFCVAPKLPPKNAQAFLAIASRFYVIASEVAESKDLDVKR
jgi:hypothetical protein